MKVIRYDIEFWIWEHNDGSGSCGPTKCRVPFQDWKDAYELAGKLRKWSKYWGNHGGSEQLRLNPGYEEFNTSEDEYKEMKKFVRQWTWDGFVYAFNCQFKRITETTEVSTTTFYAPQ